MGLTGFNKRRREAALLSRARAAAEPPKNVPASPLAEASGDSGTESEAVHRTNKKKGKAGINENSKID